MYNRLLTYNNFVDNLDMKNQPVRLEDLRQHTIMLYQRDQSRPLSIIHETYLFMEI